VIVALVREQALALLQDMLAVIPEGVTTLRDADGAARVLMAKTTNERGEVVFSFNEDADDLALLPSAEMEAGTAMEGVAGWAGGVDRVDARILRLTLLSSTS
jgi:hypothetical protein